VWRGHRWKKLCEFDKIASPKGKENPFAFHVVQPTSFIEGTCSEEESLDVETMRVCLNGKKVCYQIFEQA